jgi:DNA-directed RNA polymerase specialized sigma24 family protein
MAKRYMSDSEYEQQQFRWRHNLIDPHILQSVIDQKKFEVPDEDDEEEKQRRQELKERLWELILQKIKRKLTSRQQDALRLFLMQKKQEHMGTILGVTQEAANVRIRLGIERLKLECKKDKEIQQILADLRS